MNLSRKLGIVIVVVLTGCNPTTSTTPPIVPKSESFSLFIIADTDFPAGTYKINLPDQEPIFFYNVPLFPEARYLFQSFTLESNEAGFWFKECIGKIKFQDIKIESVRLDKIQNGWAGKGHIKYKEQTYRFALKLISIKTGGLAVQYYAPEYVFEIGQRSHPSLSKKAPYKWTKFEKPFIIQDIEE